MTNNFSRDRRVLTLTLLVLAFGYFLISDLTGGTLWVHQPQDSYTIQAMNWLQGRTYLEGGENYTWLELAIFEGRYYCSFPPLPSVVLLPLVLIFGGNTPNYLLVMAYGLGSVALAFHIMRRLGRSAGAAAFWGVFLVWGSNMLWMTTNGGVWFQAQALNMLLCLGAILAFLGQKRALSLFLLALAVGCRPFSAVYIVAFVLLFAWQDRGDGGFWRALLRQWKHCIGVAVVAAALMWYNWVRFGNPLEFGHNYLPEFTAAENGQFALVYLWNNLKNIFFRPVSMEKGLLKFDLFDGFMFYIANPMFLLLFFHQIRSLVRRRAEFSGTVLTVAMGLELLLLCVHKTFGGWQFGARYTCDLLPFALLYIGWKGPRKPSPECIALGAAAVAFNLYGTMYMNLFG